MTSQVEHTDVGAYALGLLDDDDKAAFEEHLATCPPCAAELADLSGVAGALVGIGPLDDLGPPPSRGEAEVVDLMRRKRTADRRARRGTIVIGLAAAVTLVAGGLTVGTQLGDPGAAPPPAAAGHHDHLGPAEQFYADGTPVAGTGARGVTGGLVIESKAWGTHAALKLSGVKGPLECELVSVSKSGERRVMTGWAVPAAGYGVPGQPDPLYTHGGSPYPLEQIDHFEVVTTKGEKLLTVNV
ncbi:zf-HC2 domain-containing protein [Nonomuraea sp. 3-1Str]|uniref:anti-sigma factor family protein n=1 Tax=unclassified Nonomuraea TaxID=2593643 RepID=UPI00285C1E10|nr:zf-HC2 domain-containing protein [Nonomuraea sp. 3-1Str]MDR8414864.1 zf-HC2 domain-containing protein [Nonomuraea sp. 3-1Str]